MVAPCPSVIDLAEWVVPDTPGINGVPLLMVTCVQMDGTSPELQLEGVPQSLVMPSHVAWLFITSGLVSNLDVQVPPRVVNLSVMVPLALEWGV